MINNLGGAGPAYNAVPVNVPAPNNAGPAAAGPHVPVVAHPPAQAADGAPGALGDHRLVDAETTRQIASFVLPRERLMLAGAMRSTRVDLAPIAPGAQRTVAAGRVTNLPAFESVLQQAGAAAAAASETGRDRASERIETLTALARQVRILPWRAQIGAVEQFNAALEAAGEVDASSELVVRRDEAVVEMRANVRTAARAGVNVQRLVAFHGIHDQTLSEWLQQDAVRSFHADSARGAVLVGRNVLEVAVEFGITHVDAIERLELTHIVSEHPASAGTAARAGHHVGQLAVAHGITTELGFHYLQREAFPSAMAAVSRGEDPEAVIHGQGIVNEQLTDQLMAAAEHFQAAQAARAANAAGKPDAAGDRGTP